MSVLIVTVLSSCILLAILVFKFSIWMKSGRLNIYDGLFVGGMYFVLFPLLYCFSMEPLTAGNQFALPDFSPWVDIKTVLYIVLAVFLMSIPVLLSSQERLEGKIKRGDFRLFVLVFLLYVVSKTIFFIKTGKMSGEGHWYGSSQAAFEGGAIFTLLAQFHNVGRVMLPAICLYFCAVSRRKTSLYIALLTASVMVPVELIMAGNRIALLFVALALVMSCIVLKRIKFLVCMAVIALPVLKMASIFPMVRGLMWTEQMSVAHIVDMSKKISEAKKKETDGLEIWNNPVMVATEGVNLLSLNYVVSEYPKQSPFLHGQTLLLRSVGVLVPKVWWKNKPDGLARMVGAVALPSSDLLVLNTTILGDCWANFGYFGVVIVLVVLAVFIFLPKYSVSGGIFGYLWFFVAVAAWRFDFSFFFVSLIVYYIYEVILASDAVCIFLDIITPKFLERWVGCD